MEARITRAVLLTVTLAVSMGASYRTPNFIVTNRDPQFAAQMGQAAEKYRRELAISWLGKPMPNWSRPCPMTVRDDPRMGAGGATTFVFDRGEVFGWRMTIQGSRQRLLDSVLPHEITHMIFASHFRRPLPRWADEGGATSVEHSSEKNKHKRMLMQFLRSGRGIAFNRMFAMTEYPRDIMPLYAQGYTLAELLIQRGGRPKYLAFLADGMRDNQWSAAVKKHYGIENLGALQQTWLAWVQQGFPTQTPPAAEPEKARPEVLLADAASPKRPRPAPNLIHHIPAARPYHPGSTALARHDSAVRPASAAVSAEPSRRLATREAVVTVLPAGGWHAAGTPAPAASRAVTVATTSAGAPVRNHVTCPQPVEQSRQIILQGARCAPRAYPRYVR